MGIEGSTLSEKERSLAALIGCSADPIWLVDKELLLVVANDAFLQTAQKYYGKRLQVGDPVLFAGLDADYRRNWEGFFARVFKGERVTLEYPSEGRVNPEDFYFDITLYPVYNEQKEVMAAGCYALDITQRKKAADLISKSQSELAEAQKLAQYGNWSFDLVTRRITWSDELYNIFGTDSNSFLETQDSFMDLVEEEDRKLVLETSVRSQTYGTSFDIEYRITTRAGERRIIHEVGYAGRDTDGKIIRLFGTAQNITARKRAEEAIQNSERQYKYLFENNPLPMFIWDFRTLQIIDCNDQALVKYGYSRQEFMKLTIKDFMPLEDSPSIASSSDEIFGKLDKSIWKQKKKDGELMLLDVSLRLIDFHGKRAYLVMLNDVTEKIKVEAEIKSSYQQLQELTSHLEHIREEERTRIAREIHDELGQQLTGLKMDASWISRKITTGDSLIHEKLLAMIAVIDETVKTVRRISSELRPGILDDLGLMAALEWQAQEFEKRTGIPSDFSSVHYDFNPGRTVSTDIFRVYQEALTNITRHANATRVETVLEQKDGYLKLFIKDNGEGFDLNEVRTKNSLGLTGMRERALKFHGELVIEPNKPTGTVVLLKIPLLKRNDS